RKWTWLHAGGGAASPAGAGRGRGDGAGAGGAAGLSGTRSATARAGAVLGAGRAVRVPTASPSAGLLLQLGPERRGFLAGPPAGQWRRVEVRPGGLVLADDVAGLGSGPLGRPTERGQLVVFPAAVTTQHESPPVSSRGG